MAAALHTYGPNCRLGDVQNRFIRRASVVSDTPPKLRAQFFYSSLLPIDDPLSPVPTAGAANILPPRPFSSFDNTQLEQAWLGLDDGSRSSVAVGLNRLHTVEMPELEMRPIYWSPVHDISSVVRATWFYKDKMMPVPPDIANLLEVGYQYLKPWTETYNDEVDSCINVGPEAELKIVHRLFSGNSESRPATKASNGAADTKDTESSNHVDQLPYHDRASGKFKNRAWDPQIKYKDTDFVIYSNEREAQILRRTQLPSVSGKRKPLADIRKGKIAGIEVVRGFDHKTWVGKQPLSRLQAMAARELQRKKTRMESRSKYAKNGESRARTGASTRSTTNLEDEAVEFQDVCNACVAEEVKPEVSDLILVIHGIGQKLSEKVESFHFTHSINALRRQFAIELEDPQIQHIVRRDIGTVMVLPVNWRSTLEMELDDEPGQDDGGFAGLKDITPDTIPSVRSLVSDVLLDIPYYLSHHKPKMIKSVTKEANRIYRLWCQNNPGFHDHGRVHLIAHSLGSVMALDVLSAQPTQVPAEADLQPADAPPSVSHFDFDTKNLFCCGSPAGLFVLLNRARLRPRRGRNKPGADEVDYMDTRLVGDQGTYGCLAVDNVYNVIHYNDPIAYKLNATVDTVYAASLQEAAVPSSAASWAHAFNNLLWRTTSRGGGALSLVKAKTVEQLTAAAAADLSRRPGPAPKLPSQVEMETHDFDAEELAEKRMALLNDNGQIDWFISSGGAIEFQYLDMLGAHSSYWILQDFVRFVLVEVGRAPGKHEVIASIRASKRKTR